MRFRLGASLLFAAALTAAPRVEVFAQNAGAPATRGPTATPTSSAAFTMNDALDITSATVADLSDDGRWLALTSSVRRDAYGQDYRRDGDPTYVHPVPVRLLVIDTKSGAAHPVFADKRPVRLARWSPDGDRLAMLVFNGDVYQPAVWDRKADRVVAVHLPAGRYVAENSDLRWTADGRSLVFTVHTAEWRKKARDTFTNMTTGPVFVQSSVDPFLAWDDVRRMANVRSIVAFDLKTNEMRDLVPETRVGQYVLAKDGAALAYDVDIQKTTDYDSFNSEMSLRTRSATGGAERIVFATTKGMQLQWADDGRRYAYSKDGRVYVGSIDEKDAKQLAGPAERKSGETPTPPDTTKAGRERAAKERFSVVRFSPTGDAVLVSNREGLWLVDVATSARDQVVASDDSSATSPRASFAAWTNDGQHLYLTSASRTKWERAVLRYDRPPRQLATLVRDGRTYSGIRLSKDGKTVVLSIASGNHPADVYVADESLASPRRLLESNPQLESKRLGATDLVPFLDADGHRKYAVVYYPPDYQKGKAYPTIFNVYEDFFDDTFNPQLALLAGHGYVVVQPSVDFDIGFPGEAWLKGVTSAANKLIELGITDSSKMAVQGTSYGGYATNLLVTQTNRFKAAVNISGKVDLISFYTDSPRLGVRNVNAAEKTQDRIGATMWQQPQKYEQHSAVLFADRITTPLMLVTGAQDSNVPADNTREMYYALRRLGKEVVWVNYMNGGHGAGTATAEDFLDMWRRVLGWYDAKLKGEKSKLATN
jgi:dipeptidyl aminopeptidase/acylaminoacyl peptidase